MRERRLLILGAGALAREIVLALPTAMSRLRGDKLAVTIASRDVRRAAWIVALGRSRAALADVPMRFEAAAIAWSGEDLLAETLHRCRPDLILHTASLQSAWSLAAQNAWAELIEAAGYGVTAALQGALLPALGRAMRASGVTAPIVNACYPDLINACGAQLGVDIACGLGNVALLADWFGQHLAVHTDAPLRVLAGHWEVQQFQHDGAGRGDPPRAWLGDEPLRPELMLGLPPLARDVSLNALNASSSARLLCAMVLGRDQTGIHVPGPGGLLGGYPVRLRGGAPELDLPNGVSYGEAVDWNRARSVRDGAVVDGDRVVFSPDAAERVRAVAPDLSDGFTIGDWEDAAAAFVQLREKLSGVMAGGSPG